MLRPFPVKELPKGLRTVVLLALLILVAALIGYQLDIAFPSAPALNQTLTPMVQPPPSAIGSYDVLGRAVDAETAAQLLQSEEGRQQLSPDEGAVAVTEDLIDLGRHQFYEETFGNQVFFTDVVGVLDGEINLVTVSTAIAKLAGKPTTNLQIPLEKDVTIGGREFKAGTVLNTGLDIPARSLVPLGMRMQVHQGKIRAGITCALCHAAVDSRSGRVIEGAPNNDLDTGLILAFATNSAAMFRHTGVNPTKLPLGELAYLDAKGQELRLPAAAAVEEAVDAEMLSWAPGNFDSTPTMGNNPSQNPSSYTFEAYPYGWSGHSAIGWFHGLTTLNSNVHATNSDATTSADSSAITLGIDKETYLGVLLQNSASPDYRLPMGETPSAFFERIDPTPGIPAMNEVVTMPGYPKGSPFMLDGLIANSPGQPIGQQLNAMSAWQNTLSPPSYTGSSLETLKQGAAVFDRAGCASCHSGRYFTNHRVILERQIKTQPSRAKALAAIGRSFIPPKTYPNSVTAPPPADAPVLDVPIDITPAADLELSLALNNPAGGYKVPSLIGLAVTAPYLHDGGVAATAEVAPNQLGMAGTLLQQRRPDPAASLRVLVDRQLRSAAVAANRANPDLQRANIDGSGHEYWVDAKAGFTPDEQSALIEFLLSLDDDPAVLPESLTE
ncbi:hypothetical protein IFO70_09765 [Phormidium tenue FACHB-886]|nr:hypothetical protein [Phormidium tenue FACHB-886]